jgi:hypothetical protein
MGFGLGYSPFFSLGRTFGMTVITVFPFVSYLFVLFVSNEDKKHKQKYGPDSTSRPFFFLRYYSWNIVSFETISPSPPSSTGRTWK